MAKVQIKNNNGDYIPIIDEVKKYSSLYVKIFNNNISEAAKRANLDKDDFEIILRNKSRNQVMPENSFRLITNYLIEHYGTSEINMNDLEKILEKTTPISKTKFRMLLAVDKKLYPVTKQVRKTYQLYLTYFPHVIYGSYRKPSKDLKISVWKFQNIIHGNARKIRKDKLDILVEKLIEKKIEEIKKEDVFRNERIVLRSKSRSKSKKKQESLTRKIVKEFTEIKGSCKKAASYLNCNNHTYEKYNYNEVKTIPKRILDKISLEMLDLEKYSVEQLKKIYPSENQFFTSFPWEKQKSIREIYLKRLFLKEEKKKLREKVSKEEREELKKQIALENICEDLKIKNISKLYGVIKRCSGYIPITADVKEILELEVKISNNNLSKVAKRLGLAKITLRNKLKGIGNQVISEKALISIKKHFALSPKISDKYKYDFEKILKRTRPKNSRLFCEYYFTKDVEPLVKNFKKDGFNYTDILKKINIPIASSTVQEALKCKNKKIAKPIVDIIYKKHIKKDYSSKELKKMCDLDKIPFIEKPTFITQRIISKIKKHIKKNSIRKLAKEIDLSRTRVKQITKGKVKTISKERLEKLEMLLRE